MISFQKKLSGNHAAFYYYGEQHLLVSLFNYIMKIQESNQMIIASITNELYTNLKQDLSYPNNLVYVDPKRALEIIQSDYVNELIMKGYKSVIWIIQASYIISQSSKNYFFELVETICNINSNHLISLIAYDFEDYLTKQSFIDDVVYKNSFCFSYIRNSN